MKDQVRLFHQDHRLTRFLIGENYSVIMNPKIYMEQYEENSLICYICSRRACENNTYLSYVYAYTCAVYNWVTDSCVEFS